MGKVKREDFDYTESEIVDAIETWANYPGFTADKCKCGLTANVLIGPGWFCTCGHYNILPFYNSQIPHDKPDLGPRRSTIVLAHEKARS